ncbi:branched-chain amino acid ABC transporter substrate-binding protein, partial [Calderihabitans maritimus]
PRI